MLLFILLPYVITGTGKIFIEILVENIGSSGDVFKRLPIKTGFYLIYCDGLNPYCFGGWFGSMRKVISQPIKLNIGLPIRKFRGKFGVELYRAKTPNSRQQSVIGNTEVGKGVKEKHIRGTGAFVFFFSQVILLVF